MDELEDGVDDGAVEGGAGGGFLFGNGGGDRGEEVSSDCCFEIGGIILSKFCGGGADVGKGGGPLICIDAGGGGPTPIADWGFGGMELGGTFMG